MLTCFDPTRARVAHGNRRGLLSVYQRTSPHLLWQHHQTAAITTIAWSWDGAYLASGDADGNIHLWEAQTGSLLECSRGHRGAVVRLVWSPTTYQLTSSASRESLLRIWDYSPLLRASRVKADAGEAARSR